MKLITFNSLNKNVEQRVNTKEFKPLCGLVSLLAERSQRGFFMACKALKFNPNWFLSDLGFVFKIQNRQEVRIHIHSSKRTRAPYITHNGIHYKIIDLMMEYFVGSVKITDRISHKVLWDKSIPLENIVVKPFISKYDTIGFDDEVLLFKFGCDTKAWNANGRSDKTITALEVYTALKTYLFRCFYCNVLLKPDKWELDHYYPLSKLTGINSFENIVPACKICNRMKGALDPKQFIKYCGIISSNKLLCS